ncbi:MAG: flagellar basal body-associated FliL family protein [Solirubrobacteraceae bacterium]
MKKKLIIVVVALVAAGGAYKTVLAKPAEKEKKPKVEGQVYVMPKEFLVNLSGGRFAKFSVALVMPHLPVAAGGHGAPAPPEGYGAEPQEAIIRDLITNEVTDIPAEELVDHEGREKVKKAILAAIKRKTDAHVEEVLFPDLTVQ